jgi:hypothetical protein
MTDLGYLPLLGRVIAGEEVAVDEVGVLAELH